MSLRGSPLVPVTKGYLTSRTCQGQDDHSGWVGLTGWKGSSSTSCSLIPEKMLRPRFSTSSTLRNSPMVNPCLSISLRSGEESHLRVGSPEHLVCQHPPEFCSVVYQEDIL